MSVITNGESMRSQIARLSLNESYSRSERLDFDRITKAELLAATEALRNTIAPAVRRASVETGNEYAIEIGEWRTRTRDMVLTAIVTRTE